MGPTGAGKTTIVKLLMRFYDINKGSITIDGHDIRDFDRNTLRSMFGMVYRIHGFITPVLWRIFVMDGLLLQMKRLLLPLRLPMWMTLFTPLPNGYKYDIE